MNRRKFIQTTGFACVGASTLPIILQGCSNVRYVTGVIDNKKLVVQKIEFTSSKGEKSIRRNFIIAKNEKLEFPICIYETENNQYRALYMKCTHQGCELNAYATQLVCPCHGSEFTNTGKVLQGPAEKDLLVFEVSDDSENIYIQL